jgi:hypothetical protein
MQTVAVDSAILAAIAYDAPSELLQLAFRDRTIYQYFNVPADVYEGFLRAPSKGSYFNHAIRGKFPYALIPNDSGQTDARAT